MRAERVFVFAVTLTVSVAALMMYQCVLRADSLVSPMEWVSAVLFAILAVWLSFSLAIAILGFVSLFRDRITIQKQERLPNIAPPDPNKRTSVLVPIYNESTSDVFAGVEAMYRSLAATGMSDRFDFFVLSDSREISIWLAEEAAWKKLVARLRREFPESRCGVHYRHRSNNVARKAGNISEFCRKWGSHYDYMIVLDADSLVEGETMLAMVRRMDRDDRLGIYQVPPVPIGRDSLLARIQQFSSDVYGPIFTAGFSRFSGPDANYFGHNAILRMAPFIKHCELPRLPGEAPLGGEILSHDFVEAALMSRAGYKVEIADSLGGSYEECPTTLGDFAKRDQRWCQGNLQHAFLLISEGFRPLSRLHFLTGVLSYCASPIWILFLATTLVIAFGTEAIGQPWPDYGLALFVATMVVLATPKLLALAICCLDRPAMRQRGGFFAVLTGAVTETLISILMSPIMALHHTRFVGSNLAGFSVSWDAQQRGEHGITWRQAFAESRPALWVAAGLTLLLSIGAPHLLPWFAPILLGLWFAPALTVLMGSAAVGRRLRRWNVLRTQFETSPPAIQRLRDEIFDRMNHDSAVQPETALTFESVIRSHDWIDFHAGLLQSTETSSPADDQARRIANSIRLIGPIEDIPPTIQFQLLSDHELLLSIRN
ncbi:glucans biosynthesis glucosyltransferase MdoH [Roseiconus nitratireducens]|nr:glucans biosynthesis glucosyltransferase MdoH [Roseiconus nitratireducens]